MNANKIAITTAQLLEAHTTHGNDFIVINFEGMRKYKDYSQYINLAYDKVNPIRYWKLSNDGLVVASKLGKPEDHKYESIRMGSSLVDENKEENENVKALQLLCTAFEEKMREYKSTNVVTDNDRAPRKQADGTFRPVYLISTKIVTPIQTTANIRESDDTVDLENPFFWISVSKKKFFKNVET